LIVADTNLIAYLVLGGEFSEDARAVFREDPVWAVPLLWRSEFRNVLASYMRQGELDVGSALTVIEHAEAVVRGRQFTVPDRQVMELVDSSRCSAYDCEFVALATQLGVQLVTSDKRLLTEFPTVAASPGSFTARTQ
jgi:predicted nucleic acid-binding protein